jgi:hypothetical protein
VELNPLPADWSDLRQRALALHGHRCVRCGVRDGASVLIDAGAPDACAQLALWPTERVPHMPRIGRVTLTVAHIRHDRADRDPAYLWPLCVPCHFRNDRADRAALMLVRARYAGQLYLPTLEDCDPLQIAAGC